MGVRVIGVLACSLVLTGLVVSMLSSENAKTIRGVRTFSDDSYSASYQRAFGTISSDADESDDPQQEFEAVIEGAPLAKSFESGTETPHQTGVVGSREVRRGVANTHTEPADRTKPKLISSMPAIFPWQASAAGVNEGYATVSFAVRADGTVEDVVLDETNFWAFEDPAISAVEGYLYQPAMIDGRPVSVADMRVRVDFSVFDLYAEPPKFEDLDSPDRAMQPLLRIDPSFPQEALEQGLDAGHVVLEFSITTEGNVDSVSVIESSASSFEESAVQSVAKWKYHPKMEGGEPVSVDGMRARVDFSSP